MYDVIIRKSLRHADGSPVLLEEQSKVNHEQHAVNLAGKIARDPRVEWVEVEEVKGRFKAKANLEPHGIVHESLRLARQTARRARRKPKRKGHAIFWVVIAAFALLGLFMLMTRMQPPQKHGPTPNQSTRHRLPRSSAPDHP